MTTQTACPQQSSDDRLSDPGLRESAPTQDLPLVSATTLEGDESTLLRVIYSISVNIQTPPRLHGAPLPGTWDSSKALCNRIRPAFSLFPGGLAFFSQYSRFWSFKQDG